MYGLYDIDLWRSKKKYYYILTMCISNHMFSGSLNMKMNSGLTQTAFEAVHGLIFITTWSGLRMGKDIDTRYTGL